MSVLSVTTADIKKAALISDEDRAVASLQDIASITDGGVASVCFSGFDWNAATPGERSIMLQDWLRIERSYEAIA